MVAVLAATLMRFLGGIPKTASAATRQIHTPCNPHRELTPNDIGDKQILIIGDVHGCLQELKDLFSLVKYSTEKFIVVFVGDIVNKGPENAETLQFIRNLDKNVYSVLGNHDNRVIREWNDYTKGRISKFSERYEWMSALTAKDDEYLENLPFTISIPHLQILVVHAGMFPWLPLAKQDGHDMMHMRNIVGTDILEPRATEDILQGVPWASEWPGPQHVYFGHDARRGLQSYKYATGLDTGCVYGGALTAVMISNDGRKRELVSVDARSTYQIPRNKSL